MRSRRKSVIDIKTINSPKVGRRRKQTYLQLHGLSNRRKRLKDDLERLRIRREKAEKKLSEVQEQMQILLEKSGDVEKVKSSNPSRNKKNNMKY
ncbi:hypothetical protein KGY63_02210 [Candidatus Bipolaricaulota bacterium]|nr:hypothetical protein [Candidatus Bipolaricaulota bacterium]MBS3814179.1 hypothetical protein [Candidatus Bipolaricaulota bacterium]